MRLTGNRRNLHYRLLKFCFYTLLLLNGSPVFSQADTNFWFVAPDLDSYLWQDGSVQKRFVAKQGGFYSVQVTNTCGIASDEIFVRGDDCEIFFPTGFTPNNDGLND